MSEHDATELEFAAKAVNDMLSKRMKDRKVQFMTFVIDERKGGYLGYLASSRKVDAVAVIVEWLDRTTQSCIADELIEILEVLKAAKA